MAGPWAKALVDPAIVRGEVLIQRGQRVPFLSVYHRAPLWRAVPSHCVKSLSWRDRNLRPGNTPVTLLTCMLELGSSYPFALVVADSVLPTAFQASRDSLLTR